MKALLAIAVPRLGKPTRVHDLLIHLAAFPGAPSAGSGVDDVQTNRPQLSSACESNGR